MHSNRVVTYKGKKVKIKELALRKGITPKGRQMVRTISVVWYGMDLELSIVRRIDKKGNESIVFQIATYKTSPHKHRTHYKKRWPIEKLFRTTKQHLGLQECQSLSLDVQHNHIAAVLLAYSFAQLDMKKRRLKTPEEALRRLETKNAPHLIKLFSPSAQGFHNAIT
jgi:IS4 transposase